MKKQIVRISPIQTAKVLAGLYFLISLPALLAMLAVLPFSPVGGFSLVSVAAIAAGYLLGTFLGTALCAWLYNVVAARLGGLEFTTLEVEPAQVGIR
jgi:hypothetical protein